VVIEGNWTNYRAKLLKYFRQIAVITPYADFTFTYNAENGKNSFVSRFRRRADKMPRPPAEVKHHPAAVDLELLKRLLADTRQPTMLRFLIRDFDCITRDLAERMCAEIGLGVEEETPPDDLSEKQVMRLHQLLHQARFPDPRGAHLSPAGEYNLRLGIMKEIKPEMVVTYEGSSKAHEGHAFTVEAGVSLGGREVKPGINIYRFANRIPLLFEAGNDVISQTALKRINWSTYKINPHSDRVGVFVSIVSSKIPFKGAGKEYIADDVEPIRNAVKQAIQSCCIQLKTKIARHHAIREQRNRKKNLAKYIPDAVRAIAGVLETIHDDSERPKGPLRTLLGTQADQMIEKIGTGQVSVEVLNAKLTQHVERIDMQGQLEFQVQQGLTQGMHVDLYLMPHGARHGLGPELHGQGCVVRLLLNPDEGCT